MNVLIDGAVHTAWIDDLASSEEGGIPADLSAHLFDGPQRTYAVFDTAVVNEGLALVENEPGYFGSLLTGDVAEDLADVTPCLLELSRESALTRKLFLEVPGGDVSMGTLHLWPSNPVLFIRSHSKPETLRKHLHRFLKPAGYDGLRRYVRLWNPVIVYDYLRELENPTPFLGLYLNGSGDALTLIARKGNRAVVARAKGPSAPEHRPILSESDVKALTFRLKVEFHKNLVDRVMARGDAKGFQFEHKRVSQISQQVMTAMADPERGDVPKMKDHERLTIVLLMMHDDATDIILNGPVLQNFLLPWAKRVDVVAKSYLTGLRRLNYQGVA